VTSEAPGQEQREEELLVFVSDASAEADQLTNGLRARGYSVVDVPMGQLVSRVAVQQPRVILCDVDAPAALEMVRRVRDVPGAGGIDIIFLGQPGSALDDRADAVFHEGSGFFVRPVDLYRLLQKIESLIGAPSSRVPLVPTSRPPSRATPTGPPEPISQPPASVRGTEPPGGPPSSPLESEAPAPPSVPPDGEAEPSLPPPVPLGFAPRPELGPAARQILQTELSPELEKLLAAAERRLVAPAVSPPSVRLSPEEEVEAVLPGDVLAALDEPLELDDDEQEDSAADGSVGTRGGSEARTGASRPGGTSTGGGLATGVGTIAGPLSTALPGVPPPTQSVTTPPPPRITPPEAPALDPAPAPMQAAVTAIESLPERQTVAPRVASGAVHVPFESGVSGAHMREVLDPLRFGPATVAEPVIHEAPEPASAPPAALATPEVPAALGRGEALKVLARSVRARYTGAIAFEDSSGIRRVVLRDGDFVSAASGVPGETLVAFLAARGMIQPDAAQRLGHRLPPFGRHAGAALIAHGHLRQDELWPVLRGHAEWIIAHMIAMTAGGASLERQVPPRLQAEPAVFGGATGAEILTEIARRVVSPSEAIASLGGLSGRFAAGSAGALLSECALDERERALVQRAGGASVGEVLELAGGEGFAPALYALTELGVLEVLAPLARPNPQTEPPEYDRLDDEAIRERIRARRALVDEGDYFALLGLPREATGYDIRRAYLELRRELEPSRLLTAATVDLRDDAELVIEVLDEAYEILRDQLRRDRYRRALEALPHAARSAAQGAAAPARRFS
jgi:CheY-like chemotaxis protein